MADPTPSDFSEAGTLRIVRQACAATGHGNAPQVECLRLGENAIYRVVDAPIVVRVARSLQMLDDVRKEIRVARWLEQAGLPAARLAAETHDDALIVDGRYPVTFWQLIRSTAPNPDEADLGRLLRQLHTLQPPEWVQLPAFWPFVRVAERLGSPPASADPDDVTFLAQLFADLQAQYQDLVFHFPPSPVHGDAHRANLMRDASGQVVLIDFETFSYGHREWDLTITGIRREGFSWLDGTQYRCFTDAYGYDILDWPGFPVFRAIRELTMTTWLMQLVDNPAAREEFHRRVDDIRNERFPRRWRAF
jgi:aminoglycoside phosphotransferase (APT) family kinase protein